MRLAKGRVERSARRSSARFYSLCGAMPNAIIPYKLSQNLSAAQCQPEKSRTYNRYYVAVWRVLRSLRGDPNVIIRSGAFSSFVVRFFARRAKKRTTDPYAAAVSKAVGNDT